MGIKFDMKNLLSMIVAIVGGVVIYFVTSTYLFGELSYELSVRLPGQDGSENRELDQKKEIAGFEPYLEKFDGKASDIADNWLEFRGPDRSGIVSKPLKIPQNWQAGAGNTLWKVTVGEGYAGATVYNGMAFFIDYDKEKQADVICCISMKNGADIWKYYYPVKIKRNHGMSRTVPTIVNGLIVTMGPKCHLTCLDAITGDFKWQRDLVKDYNVKIPQWYAGQCPFIEDGKIIVGTGGDAMVVALNLVDGEEIWKSPNPDGWDMTHVSILKDEFKDRELYIYNASGGVGIVDAKTGGLISTNTEWRIKIAAVATPIGLANDKIFFTGGYNAGSALMGLVEKDGVIELSMIKELDASEFGSEQQTPIYYEGYIYGVSQDEQMACLDEDANIIWRSGSAEKFGLGPYLVVDGKLLIVDDHGVLTVADASPNGYRRIEQAKILDGHDSWGPLAIVDSKLIARDMTTMICVDLSKGAE